MTYDPTALPEDLPNPVDDGAAAHLAGSHIPDVALRATSGEDVSSPGFKGARSSTPIPAPGDRTWSPRPAGT